MAFGNDGPVLRDEGKRSQKLFSVDTFKVLRKVAVAFSRFHVAPVIGCPT
jgi:hypothetical protein